MYRDSLFYLYFTSKPRNVQISLLSRTLHTITDLTIPFDIFGHSKFVPVFLGKIVGKNSEQPFCHSKRISVFLGKIVGKNLEQSFLAIPN